MLSASKFLWNSIKSILLELAKTDMRNIKYALELFVDSGGNICKKNVIESLKLNNKMS